MNEYFRPTHIWNGKLCYLKALVAGRGIMTPVKLGASSPGRVEVITPDFTCIWVDETEIFDVMEGHPEFRKLESPKVQKLLDQS